MLGQQIAVAAATDPHQHAEQLMLAGLFRPSKTGPLKLYVEAAEQGVSSQPGLVFQRR